MISVAIIFSCIQLVQNVSLFVLVKSIIITLVENKNNICIGTQEITENHEIAFTGEISCNTFLDLNIEFSNNKFDTQYNERWFSPIDRTLRRELKSKFNPGEYWFDTTSYKELIDLRIKYGEGYFKFLVSKDRVTSS